MNIVRAVSVALVLLTAACTRTNVSPEPPPPEGRVSFERNTSFDGEVLRLEFPREDGGTEKFSTLRDTEFTLYSDSSFIPNHVGRNWWLVKTATEGTSIVYAGVSWDNDDPTDYLALGYWIHFPGEHPGYRWNFNLAQARYTPFFDGPEFDPSDPPRLPISGTATFAGPVAGLYYYRYGSDWTRFNDPVAVAQFRAPFTMTANFEDDTLAGCMGCFGDIELDESRYSMHVWLREGFVERPLALPTDYEVHFRTTDIHPSGTFEHTDVEVTHPMRTVTGSEGFWGGIFSNVPDADGNPRMAIGRTGVTFDEADGSQGEFDAIFISLGQSLIPSRESEDP